MNRRSTYVAPEGRTLTWWVRLTLVSTFGSAAAVALAVVSR